MPVKEEFQRVAKGDDDADRPQVMSHRVSPGETTCKVVSLEGGSRGRKKKRGGRWYHICIIPKLSSFCLHVGMVRYNIPLGI